MERAPKLEEIGAGVQLTPNASRALERLGVLDAVQEQAVEAEALSVACGETGKELARAPLADAAARFGSPWLLTLRADLQRALHAAADDIVDIEFEFGTEVTDFAAHARGTTALTPGSAARAAHSAAGFAPRQCSSTTRPSSAVPSCNGTSAMTRP